jgi:hypothetical protein
MAINALNSVAAVVAGGVAALGASTPQVQNISPIAPGIGAAAIAAVLLGFGSDKSPVQSAGYGVAGVAGVLLIQGVAAMRAQAAAKTAGTQQSAQGQLFHIQGDRFKSVLPGQTNIGRDNAVPGPGTRFGNLMPATSQGMSGQRFVRAFDTMVPGVQHSASAR